MSRIFFWVGVAGLFATATALTGPPPALAASSPTTTVISDFDNSWEWVVSDGSAALSTQSSVRTSGTGALKVNYNIASSGAVGLVPAGTPAELPGLPRRISMDIYEDGSWNTVYYELRDSTGEILRYWLANLSSVGWQTVTLDLDTATPISGAGGNQDHVLDLPASFSRFLIWRNGSQPAIGTVYLDHLTYTYDPSALTAASPIFVPSAGQTSAVTLSLTDAGTFSLHLIDEAGRTRTYGGSSGGGSSWSTTWDGRDDSNRVMSGSVRALLTVTRGSKVQNLQLPYFFGLPTRAPGANASQRGINSFLTEIDTRARSQAASSAAQMEAAEVGTAREEFEWRRVEPSRGVYDWPKFDQAVEIERAHGIAILGKLAYGSPWDTTAPPGTDPVLASRYPPANIQDYVDYVVATVHRYKDRVHAWEIWNEENNAGCWEPAPDPARYTALLRATYAAIKAEDPTATVVLGGLSTGTDKSFLQGIHDNGGWGSFDVLAIHSFVAGPPDGSAFETWINDAKNVLAAYGNKPIWITEFGWSSYTGSGSSYIGVTLDEQELYLERSYEIAAQAGVQGIFWFELTNRGTNAADSYQNSGVLYADLSPKLAYYGLQCEDQALYAGTTPTCSNPTYPAGTYHALVPSRLLDTRSGTGLSGYFTSHSPRSLQVTGSAVPASATAVTGNLTVTQQTSAGFLYIGPQPRAYPATSTLNFPVRDDRANSVTVALGTGGVLWITFAAPTIGPTAQVVFDVTGYFTPDMSGATYHPLTPTRILDSRDGTGGISSPFKSHQAQAFPIWGAGGVPSGATAVTGNLTVTQQTSLGFLYIGPDRMDDPTSSNLNFPTGDDRANAVTVQVSSDGKLYVTYAAPVRDTQTAHVIFDVTGYFTADATGMRYVPVAPSRILDSRAGTGGVATALTSHLAVSFPVLGQGGVPGAARAVTGNLTVTQQSSLGFLYVGPNRMDDPTSSNLNFPVRDDRANAVTVALSGDGKLWVTYAAPLRGPTAHAIFDVTGYFTP